MKTSIIILTYNAEDDLRRLFQSLTTQTYVADEIIVVDSSSTDRTLEIAKQFRAKIFVIPKSQFDHAGTRTYSTSIASGDIIIFLTQDVEFCDPNSISNLVSIFKDNSISAAYGRQLPRQTHNPLACHLRNYNYPPDNFVKAYADKKNLGIKTIFLSNSYAAYRKADLKKIGYFGERLIFGEDSLACFKLLQMNKKVAYKADATVIHSHDYNLKSEFRRSFDTGVFHKLHESEFSEFRTAENEGFRYTVSLVKFLISRGNYIYLMIAPFSIASRLLGYKLGKIHKFIPRKILLKLTMSPWWWQQNKEGL